MSYFSDVMITLLNELEKEEKKCCCKTPLSIKKVIVHEPAVVIFWSDNTKTKAICAEGDTFSAEAGFAIAAAKKFMGNAGYHKTIRKYLGQEA